MEKKETDIGKAIERMPKVELHVHFGGAVSAETIGQLADRNGVELGDSETDSDASRSRYGHLIGFLDAYRLRCKCFQGAHDFEEACIDVLTGLREQRVRYVEITVCPTPYRLNGVPMDEIIRGIEAGVGKMHEDGAIEARFILDVGRQFGVEHAWQTVREAVRYQSAGVIAVGLGGDELHYSPEIFEEQFAFARKEGLHRVAHAGEAGGPDSIWGALRALDAERIGHGVAANGDDLLIEHLRAKKIPVEMCPTSNIETGAVRSYADHPLPEFFRRGLLVTLNSDDPAMFGASLTDEYKLCREEFGLDWDDIKTLCLNGVKASFLPDLDKQQMLEEFERELAEIESDLRLG